MSWTTSISAACWFATRYNLPEPAIFAAELTDDDIFTVVHGAAEREIIARPKVIYRIQIDHASIVGLTDRYIADVKLMNSDDGIYHTSQHFA